MCITFVIRSEMPRELAAGSKWLVPRPGDPISLVRGGRAGVIPVRPGALDLAAWMPGLGDSGAVWAGLEMSVLLAQVGLEVGAALPPL